MKTKFNSKAELIRDIETGQSLFIDNHFRAEGSRVTTVKTKQSYFFTVLGKDGTGESWIINGITDVNKYGFTFKPEEEKVEIYFKKNNMPFLTLHFNETIIKGKS
jgi:hypothetical protein